MDYKYADPEWPDPGRTYLVWWGYEDQKLFEFAKQKVTELAAQPEPFNLTMLTVDTHFEDGYMCEGCPKLYGDDQYSNVMRCSSQQVASFIRWIQQQDFYENTTIVLCGDHPTMDSDYCEDVDSDTSEGPIRLTSMPLPRRRLRQGEISLPLTSFPLPWPPWAYRSKATGLALGPIFSPRSPLSPSASVLIRRRLS